MNGMTDNTDDIYMLYETNIGSHHPEEISWYRKMLPGPPGPAQRQVRCLGDENGKKNLVTMYDTMSLEQSLEDADQDQWPGSLAGLVDRKVVRTLELPNCKSRLLDMLGFPCNTMASGNSIGCKLRTGSSPGCVPWGSAIIGDSLPPSRCTPQMPATETLEGLHFSGIANP